MTAIISSIPHVFYNVIRASSRVEVYMFTSLNLGSPDCFDQKNKAEGHSDSSGDTLCWLSTFYFPLLETSPRIITMTALRLPCHDKPQGESKAKEKQSTQHVSMNTVLGIQPNGEASDDSSPHCHLTITTWETPNENLGGPRQPKEPWEIIINYYFKTLNFEVACQAGIEHWNTWFPIHI